jgi:hypothetical protein
MRFGGDEVTSELFEFVALDEITHVAFGNVEVASTPGKRALGLPAPAAASLKARRNAARLE